MRLDAGRVQIFDRRSIEAPRRNDVGRANRGKADDYFVKRNGEDYVGPVWPGPSVFPDFTREETRKWWGTPYKAFADDGIAGFWNDMNEPAVLSYPSKTMLDDVQHRIAEPGFVPRTMTHLGAHNIYGMENFRATCDGLLALAPNIRPFVLTRTSYVGGQRYAATWTGENLSTWNHLRQTMPQLLNLFLSGFYLSGTDVGAFGGSPSLVGLSHRKSQLRPYSEAGADHNGCDGQRSIHRCCAAADGAIAVE